MAQRGEIWWVNLDPPTGSEIAKTRPCVVLTSDVLNQRRRTVVVVPLSSSPDPAPPILVPVRCGGKDSVAVTDQIRAVSKQRLDRRMDSLSEEDLRSIEEAVREILGLD
jgi:mRNA interferase MazF